MAGMDEVSKLMKTPEKIRNIGTVAHIDHGKTTLSDNLLAGAKMISEKLAGKQRFMDFDEQEQERGITIYSANVSMVHKYKNDEYLINLIDTPGHVDFGGDVTRAMRAVDGVLVIACAVEGVMPQTETVIRQALKENVRPILFINKADRMIKELKLTPEDMQKRFEAIIQEVNILIQKFAEKQFREKWLVNVLNGSVAFGSAYKNWAMSVPFMKETGVTFKNIIDWTEQGNEEELLKKCPLSDVVLDMVIRHLPNPVEAQSYRIPRIWSGDKESEAGKSMMNCDPNGKLVAVVTKICPDPHAKFVATARIFSGKMHEGSHVHLVSKKTDSRIQQVSIYKGQQRLPMSEVPAGNIVGIIGLNEAFSGETICESDTDIEPFESITHMFEPVVTKSLEPKDTKDLQRLIDFLKQISREDPGLVVQIKPETGEYLVSGMGELHLEAKVERKLKEKNINVDMGKPIVVYRETAQKRSDVVEGKSPNKHNKFYIHVEPLEESVYQAMVNGDIKDQIVKGKDIELAKKLSEFGMDYEEAKRVKMINNKCFLIDVTKGVQYLNEVYELIKDSFKKVTEEGPIAKEPMSSIKVMLSDATLHEDAIHRGPAQIIPAVSMAINEAVMRAGPSLLEPKQIIRIDCPTENMGNVTTEIQNRRGQILSIDDERGGTVLKCKVPVSELFGFDAKIKSATGGKGFHSLIDIVFERIPNDLYPNTVKQIRERKGLKTVEA